MSKKKKQSGGKSGGKKPDKKSLKKEKKNSAKNSTKKAAKPAKKAEKKAPKTKAPKKTVKAAQKKIEKKPVTKSLKTSKPVNKPKKAAPVKTKPAPKSKPGLKEKSGKSDSKPAKTTVKIASSSRKNPEASNGKAKTIPVADQPKKLVEEIFNRKPPEKKATDVLAITNTIPVTEKSEISASKIASISHSITNPVKRTDSYAVKAEKEPPGKFEMEFVVHSSAEMLYEFLSTPSGLSEWFCDDLNIRNGIYTFIWDDQLQQARLLKTVELQLVRFQWVDKTDGSYFEFRIQRDDLTNDISLIITDFADTHSERESAKLLWHSQIEKLMHVIGSIF